LTLDFEHLGITSVQPRQDLGMTSGHFVENLTLLSRAWRATKASWPHRSTWPLMAVALFVVSDAPLRAENINEVPFNLYQHHLVVAKGSIGPLNNLNLLIDTARFRYRRIAHPSARYHPASLRRLTPSIGGGVGVDAELPNEASTRETR
jgi:hypothetical protein